MEEVFGKDSVLDNEPNELFNPAVAELIVRLEQATEGSWQLDYDVTRAAFPSIMFRIEPAIPAALSPARVMATTSGGMDTHVRLAEYTRSLDAALMLAPKGWGWFLDYMDPGEPDGAGVGPHICDGSMDGMLVRPPALALCIAALKARLSTDGTVDGPSSGSNTDESK